jgi:DNA replication and repair protein RecF
VRTVVFAPDDLALVKGDPTERRRFLDDLLVLHQGARYAGTRADYDRVLKQRNTLLKTARVRGSSAESALSTLEVWDAHLAKLGAEIMTARSRLVEDLNPLLGKAYEAVARGAAREDATLGYRPSFEPLDTEKGEPAPPPPADLEQAMLAEIARRRRDELERGMSLVGPHRDDLLCSLGEFPVKGYASHGESWSFALAMRLASYELLRSTGDDPVLILDDVFAELDTGRRAQLADLVSGAEQVLVTAAVPEDIPEGLRGRRFDVADGEVTPVVR